MSPEESPLARPEVIESSARLWAAIVERAGLELKQYDQQLLDEIAAELGLPAEGFGKSLDKEGVSATRLLVAFLQAVAPFAGMLRDILAFFASAAASSSDHNLRIRFDFEGVGEDFEFDLRTFREWEQRFEAVLDVVEVHEVSEMEAHELRHAFVALGTTYTVKDGRWDEIEPDDEVVRTWLASDEQTPGPTELPAPPPTDNDELARLLLQTWQLLRLAESRELLAKADVRAIVRGAYLLTEEDRAPVQRLRELFVRLPTSDVEMTVQLARLDEIFNLPVWSRRADLYAVWVGTRLIKALGPGVQVHTIDRSIVFSYSGSHLATLALTRTKNLHVWSELRTPLSKPLGKSRKNSIQPDYVLCGEPMSHPQCSVLVVECKQYRRQGVKNFSEALIDYARGHPSAQVLLVNYGPTTSAVGRRVASVAADVHDRTLAIGKFRPGSFAALAEFEATVRSASAPTRTEAPKGPVKHPRAVEAPPPTPSPFAGSVGRLTLSWGEEPKDLDIHCWITDASGDEAHVFHRQRAWQLDNSLVELDGDVRDGSGPETVHWNAQPGTILRFAVNNFSGESPIAGCGARVEAAIGGATLEMSAPTQGEGLWWHLFEIDALSGGLRLVNTLKTEGATVDERSNSR